LDVVGALDSLPDLPLGDDRAERERATGTADLSALAPMLAPNLGKRGTRRANGDETGNGDPVHAIDSCICKAND
jgi:hypothetical protein